MYISRFALNPINVFYGIFSNSIKNKCNILYVKILMLNNLYYMPLVCVYDHFKNIYVSFFELTYDIPELVYLKLV